MLLRRDSGIRTIVPVDLYERRCDLAQWGEETGRWSAAIVALAIGLAGKASASLEEDIEWLDFIDDLADRLDGPSHHVGGRLTNLR